MPKRKGPGRKSGGSSRRVRTAKATRRAARKATRAAARPRSRAKTKPKAKTARNRAAARTKTARTKRRAPAKRSAARAAKAPARRAKSTSRRSATSTARPAAKTAAKTTAKTAAKTSAKTAARAPRTARTAAVPKGRASAPAPAPTPAKAARPSARRVPLLDRERRTVREDEPAGPPSSLDLPRSASSVRSGRAELAEKLHRHTSTGPALTAGDIDADWGSAEAVGDEAPGGDNPTPDQDVVEEIGKALGVRVRRRRGIAGRRRNRRTGPQSLGARPRLIRRLRRPRRSRRSRRPRGVDEPRRDGRGGRRGGPHPTVSSPSRVLTMARTRSTTSSMGMPVVSM